ncbi:hypothetical protein Bca52824_016688 [Brassica carinata]|uniref:F-box associated beta-propeller type 1 domain-containing protein n=1 Tax=Brassica carinata TaxID=52824 RepID=A0A8X7W6W3_BRACI|nr:hypothetical protein Bca52824_016688 [Brassica carinata]
MSDLPRDMEEEVLCRIPGTSLGPIPSTCKSPKDHSSLLVWNPYRGCGQPRWIEHTHNHHKVDKHLYGHLDKYMYGLRYDSSRSYKVLRFIDYLPNFIEFKIYDFNSDLWRIILDLLPPRDWRISFDERGLSIKGNTYWFASSETRNSFLVCFDLTRETFWSPLPLPFEAFPDQDTLSLSTSVSEQLVVLFQMMEIWISTTIEQSTAVFWNTKVFLSANIKQLADPLWQFWPSACFFIDEEKKVAVVFDKNNHMGDPTHEVAYIFGVDGSLKQEVV